ncbi:uncharacterized protein LOC122204466 [Panthera leo]|uniref:uncharacterized protein LOC122204466 n=1 Tax=Panthera leo TaxID=9689 RepID=UPI001C69A267|nr:uncharacterized protein LOC122204466 [Panthera leo]
MLLECPEQRLAGWLARERPFPSSREPRTGHSGTLVMGPPHGSQGPGAKEARRAGSPLPRGAARPPVCVPLPCRPWPEPRQRGRAPPTSVFLLACPLLWSLGSRAGARAASTTASCAHRVPGPCGGPEEAALAGMRTVTPASLHPLFLVSVPCVFLPRPAACPASPTGAQLPGVSGGAWLSLGGAGRNGLVWKRLGLGPSSHSSFSQPPFVETTRRAVSRSLLPRGSPPPWGSLAFPAGAALTVPGDAHRDPGLRQPPAAFQRARPGRAPGGRGPCGVASGWDTCLQGSSGTTFLKPAQGSKGCGLRASPGGRECVCVCVCVSAVCAVDKTVYLPGGARALPAPLGSFLSGKWDAGVTSAQPSCPCCRGLAGGGLPATGGEGLAVCPGRLHLHSVSRSAGGGGGGPWRQVQRWEGPLTPSHRQEWTCYVPEVPSECSRAVPQPGILSPARVGCRPQGTSVCLGGRRGWAARAHSCLSGSGLCLLGVLVHPPCLTCLSNKAWPWSECSLAHSACSFLPLIP